MTERPDVVVVGAGSSGCALASRLAENQDRQVLLIEAGVDYGALDDYPFALQHSYNLSASLPGDPHGWSYIGELTPEVSYPVTRGKVLGGSSAVNGGQFTRGTVNDYESWSALGNSDWSFEKVLPFFVRLEADRDFGPSEWHGDRGPIPVLRPTSSELSPIAEAFVESVTSMKFPWDDDMNAPGSSGVGLLPHNVVAGRRFNVAATYLPPERRTTNLKVLDQALAVQVLFEKNVACGVRVVRHGQPMDILAGEVVIAAGGLNSPHLLLLSGVGPADDLRRLGIPVVHHLTGVGRNLMDHPSVVVTYRTRNYTPTPDHQPAAQVCFNFTAEQSPYPDDMRIFPFSFTKKGMLFGQKGDPLLQRWRDAHHLRHPRSFFRALKGSSGRALIHDVKTRSDLALYCGVEIEDSRGQLELTSSDPTRMPKLHYGYMSEPSDRRRLREGVRVVRELLDSGPFRGLGAELTGATQAIDSDKELDQWIAGHITTASHTSGTCKMGPPSDPGAVVDQRCQVVGLEHLRVVDTSIMPTIVRRGTNATAIMIGERASAFFE